MRELKFRAWNVGPPKMYDLSATDYPLHIVAKGDTDYTKFMQFTGCRDFFDTEIYEGDIVFLDAKMLIGEIVMDCYAWKIKTGDSFEWLCDWFEDVQVIGNIYENPDLLAGA